MSDWNCIKDPNKKVKFELLRKKVLENKNNFTDKDKKCLFCRTFNFDKWYLHFIFNKWYLRFKTFKRCPMGEILATEDVESEWVNLIASIYPYITKIPFANSEDPIDDIKLSLFNRF